jgi:hypothetical protein
MSTQAQWATASAIRKQLARLRVARQLRDEFGELSERDVAIFAFGKGIGYTDGYNAASRRDGGKKRA